MSHSIQIPNPLTTVSDTRIKLTSPIREIDPLVLHCPKLAHPVWRQAEREWDNQISPIGPELNHHFEKNSEPQLLIITWNSRNETSRLEDQLNYCCLPHTTLGRGIGSKWKNIDKIRLTHQFLRDVNAEEFPYVMGIDGDDAMLLASPYKILQRYKEISRGWGGNGQRLLFGAERNHYPKCKTIRSVAAHEKSVAEKFGDMPWCHFNSGCFIGPTTTAKFIFERATQAYPAPRTPESDQGAWRTMMRDAGISCGGGVELDRRFQLFATVTKYDPDDAVAVAS